MRLRGKASGRWLPLRHRWNHSSWRQKSELVLLFESRLELCQWWLTTRPRTKSESSLALLGVNSFRIYFALLTLWQQLFSTCSCTGSARLAPRSGLMPDSLSSQHSYSTHDTEVVVEPAACCRKRVDTGRGHCPCVLHTASWHHHRNERKTVLIERSFTSYAYTALLFHHTRWVLTSRERLPGCRHGSGRCPVTQAGNRPNDEFYFLFISTLHNQGQFVIISISGSAAPEQTRSQKKKKRPTLREGDAIILKSLLSYVSTDTGVARSEKANTLTRAAVRNYYVLTQK